MKKFLKNFFAERKKEIADNGLFYCIFVWLFFGLLFVLSFPIWSIGAVFILLNDCSKTWFGGSSNV